MVGHHSFQRISMVIIIHLYIVKSFNVKPSNSNKVPQISNYNLPSLSKRLQINEQQNTIKTNIYTPWQKSSESLSTTSSISTSTTSAASSAISKSNSSNSKSIQTPYVIPIESYIVLTMLFLVTALCSLDRVAMSVAIIPMSLELGYNDEVKGAIATMFSFGYLFGIIPAGVIDSFTSPRIVLALGVFLWSAAQAVSPWAAQISLPLLLFFRFCMGLAEAAAIPTVQSFVSRFVPEEKKSLILGIILSGLQVGNVGAFLFSPAILDQFEWSGLLIAYGLVGILWLLIWLPFSTDQPVTPLPLKAISTSTAIEKISPISKIKSVMSNIIQPAIINKNPLKTQYTQLSTSSSSTENLSDKFSNARLFLDDVPFKQMIESKSVQAIAVAHSVQNFGLYINLSWLPTYFNEKYGLSVNDSSFASVLPWVAGACVGPFMGWAADKLISTGTDKTLARKMIQSFALITPAAALVSLSQAQDLTSSDAISYFVLAVAFAAACVAGFGSSTQDICATPKYVSIVYSITSAPAVLIGSLGVYLTGVILENTHSFSLVFQGTAAVYVVGAIFYILNYDAKKIF